MTELDDLRAALLALTPVQAAAAEALATGSTHAEAAELADVARETVTRWAGHHPGFRAALDLYRSMLATETADRARRLRRKALDAAEAGLEAGDVDPLALLRAVPEPIIPRGRPVLAAELLDTEIESTRRTMPAPGPLDFDALDSGGRHRAEDLAIRRLTDASTGDDDHD